MADLDSPPPVAGWFQDGFHRFLRRFLRKNFHAIGVHRESEIPAEYDGQPLVFYGNHPSWWDPLIAHFLNRHLMSGRQFYAPIDSSALQQYKVFAKLGFYGVDLDSKRGAADFLQISGRILDAPNTAIWLTPEGRFTDVRDHSVELMPGLSHLARKCDKGHAIPLALEYVFWDEKLPVCLAMFGAPISFSEDLDKPEWSQRLTDALRSTQAFLAQNAIKRSSEPFDNLLRGKQGAGVVYDTFRRCKSMISGQRFRATHGEQFK